MGTFEHPILRRYSDPPPDGVKPDPDYVPKEGEWFWWKADAYRMWYLRCNIPDGAGRNAAENKYAGEWQKYELAYYKSKCLPAMPPD